tara:strand:- start:487 stop:702 length:216 start_codon:yes stop_codon:yes gene_type:complete
MKENIEKPIRLKDLALEWSMHEKTLKKHFNQLRIKFPDEPCLNRYINNKAIIYPSDLAKIKQCQTILKSDS